MPVPRGFATYVLYTDFGQTRHNLTGGKWWTIKIKAPFFLPRRCQTKVRHVLQSFSVTRFRGHLCSTTMVRFWPRIRYEIPRGYNDIILKDLDCNWRYTKKFIYPLVNIQKAIENGHFWLIYPLKLVIFHSFLYVCQRVDASFQRKPSWLIWNHQHRYQVSDQGHEKTKNCSATQRVLKFDYPLVNIQKNYGTSPLLVGKSTISMGRFQ